MRRKVIQTVTQPAVGQAMTLNLAGPPTETWRLRHISLEIPGFFGQVQAVVTIDGVFVCGTNDGQKDSADGDGPDLDPGQTLAVAWGPVFAAAPVQGRLFLVVDQARA